MKRGNYVFALALIFLIISIAACGRNKSNELTVTPTPAESKKPTATPTPQAEIESFASLDNLLAAYGDDLDQSFTPLDLNQRIDEQDVKNTHFPKVEVVAVDDQGVIRAGFGEKVSALLIDRFVITTYLPDFSGLITDDNFLPPPLQGQNLTIRHRIIFRERPDGTEDYELLKGSIARDENLVLEILERSEGSIYPYPDSLGFPIQDLNELSPADRLLFYRNQDPIRGSVSAIENSDRGIIAMDGSVGPEDRGAPVFSLRCGEKTLLGIVLGSYRAESFAISLNSKEVVQFIKENTGIDFSLQESKKNCPKPDNFMKERLVNAISDRLYDLSYDMTDLKNPNFESINKLTPQFQNFFTFSEKGSEYTRVVSSGRVLLMDNYVVVSASATTPSFSYRLFWGEDMVKEHEDSAKYEDLEFVGFDKTKEVALFKRPYDTKFPVPDGMRFAIGNSEELEIGTVLYSMGSADFSLGNEFNVQKSVDPASVIGFSSMHTDRFYFQGSSIRNGDPGALIFASRDGELELVGLLFSKLENSNLDGETLGTALTIEFVLSAVDEIKCSKLKISCVRLEKLDTLHETKAASPQAEKDREQIIALLKDGKPDRSSLLTDMLRPGVSAVSDNERKVLVVQFQDIYGNIIEKQTLSGEAVILSDKYVLTLASFFPQAIIISESGEISLDKSDIKSNIISSDQFGNFGVRVILTDKFSLDYRNIAESEMLEVVIVDRENGYALLKRPVSALGTTPPDKLYITPIEELAPNQEIFLSFSKDLFVSDGLLSRAKLISPGTIIRAGSDSPTFTLKGFISKENLGTAIYTMRDGKIELVGIVSRTYSAFYEQIQTEGFGLSMDFIFKKIKEKTGVDLYAEINSKE